MNIEAIKGDSALLLAELQQERLGQHLKCPAHKDATGSLAIWRGDDGIMLWKCHAGCGGGTIIDAMAIMRGVTPAQAIKQLQEEMGVAAPDARRAARPPPTIDVLRAERFLEHARSVLNGSFDVQERYMLGKRRLSIDVCTKYGIGFVQAARFHEWASWRIHGWVLPITDASGRLMAVKIHNEFRAQPKTPKCLWAPFGMLPKAKPVHGMSTFWPPPETQAGPDLFIHPGELKALAAIAGGQPATSPTAGEAADMRDECQRMRGRRVILVPDQDEPGQRWAQKMTAALARARVECLVMRPGAAPPPAAPVAAGAGAPPACVAAAPPIVNPNTERDEQVLEQMERQWRERHEERKEGEQAEKWLDYRKRVYGF